MARYLADKSALARSSEPLVERRLAPLLLAGELATCSIVDLEMLFSARHHRDFVDTLELRRGAYAQASMQQADFGRAIEVMERLSKKSQHRGVTIPHLLIAAVAERERMIVLHYDSDFDRIAVVTGQKTEWVVFPGSVS